MGSEIVLDAQRSESKWIAVSDLIAASNVRENTKAEAPL
jgi:hypothetical protein